MPTRDCVIIGAGGHAKVVLDAYLSCHPEARVELRDDAATKAGMSLLGLTVMAPVGPVEALRGPCHVAIGNNQDRRKIGASIIDAGVNLIKVLHPRAVVSKYARIECGVFVAAGSIVAADAKVEVGAIINHAAIVDHDCIVGSWSHIAPNAVLGGAVTVGEGCLIGSGAVVLPGVRIGDGAIVGAGAIVTRDVQEATTVVGVPARNVA